MSIISYWSHIIHHVKLITSSCLRKGDWNGICWIKLSIIEKAIMFHLLIIRYQTPLQTREDKHSNSHRDQWQDDQNDIQPDVSLLLVLSLPPADNRISCMPLFSYIKMCTYDLSINMNQLVNGHSSNSIFWCVFGTKPMLIQNTAFRIDSTSLIWPSTSDPRGNSQFILRLLDLHWVWGVWNFRT